MKKSLKQTIRKNREKADLKKVEVLKDFYEFSQEQSLLNRLAFCWKVITKKLL